MNQEYKSKTAIEILSDLVVRETRVEVWHAVRLIRQRVWQMCVVGLITNLVSLGSFTFLFLMSSTPNFEKLIIAYSLVALGTNAFVIVYYTIMCNKFVGEFIYYALRKLDHIHESKAGRTKDYYILTKKPAE